MEYSEFPLQIFNGLHTQRPDSSTVSPPDSLDYWILVRELSAVQKYVLNLAQNINIMPDLEGELKAAQVQVEALQDKIKLLTPPRKLTELVSQLADKLLELDTRKDVSALRSEIMSLHDTIVVNQIQGLKLQESFAKDVKGFQNRITNLFKKLEKDTSERLNALESKMSKVHLQAEVGNLLKRLEQI